MFKNIKYLLASLFVVFAIAACGGGGGGSSTPGGSDGVGNIPESPPIESTPVESQPGNTSVSITSTGISTPGNTVVAGQNFQITATVTSGGSATITFANATGTPASVKYSPSSCLVEPGKPCHTTASVALGTPKSTTNYATKISTTTSDVTLSAQDVYFSVVTPKLIVSTNPTPSQIAINTTTTVGFGIAPGSVPAGSGSIEVQLGSFPLGVLSPSPAKCKIYYNADGSIGQNDCAAIEVKGEAIGADQVLALATGFDSAASNTISVVSSGDLPYVVISTTRLAAPSYSVAAGQTFKITATSYNSAVASVHFTNGKNTPGVISYSVASCQLNANSSCQTTVLVPFGTTPSIFPLGGYSTLINFTNTTQSLPDQEVKFGVHTPKLSFQTKDDDLGILLLNKSIERTITIESDSIPDGNSYITVNLNQTNLGVIGTQNPFNSCKIHYSQGVISNNECQSGVIGKAPGNTTIQANAAYFKGTNDNITVTPYIVYVAQTGLDKNPISMYSAYLGELTRIRKSIDNIFSPHALARDISGKFLYVVDKSIDRISMYSINGTSGELAELSPSLVSTGQSPSAIAVNPNNTFSPYLYITNSISNNIGIYSINNTTGQLRLVSTSSTGKNPVALAVSPNGRYLYVANYESASISPFFTNSDGSLTGASLPVNIGGRPNSLTIESSGNYVYATIESSTAANSYIMIYPIVNQLVGGGNLGLGRKVTGLQGIPSGIVTNGNFAYVLSKSSNIISIYSITQPGPNYGLLNYVNKVSTGISPVALTFDPTGTYAYVTNNGSNSVSMYSVDRFTGLLSPLSPATVGTELRPIGMSMIN